MTDESKPAKSSILLALDTSTEQAAIALVVEPGKTLTARPDPAARHGRILLPTIQGLLEQAGLKVSDIDGFVVGIGPGSYTGLRIGVTAAKTLAYVGRKPLSTFDSLELLARNAPADALKVSAIADAQRGDVYAATFHRPSPGDRLVAISPTAIRPFEVWAEAIEEGTFVVGPAVLSAKFSGRLPTKAILPADLDHHWPAGDALGQLASDVFDAGVRADLWFLEPAYFRRSAAEDQWEKRKVPGSPEGSGAV